MNYKSFNLGDWIGHISGVIDDETTLDGNEMRDLVEFLTTLNQEPILDKIRAEIEEQMKIKCFDTDDEMFAYRTGLENAIDMIDKYKAESEE